MSARHLALLLAAALPVVALSAGYKAGAKAPGKPAVKPAVKPPDVKPVEVKPPEPPPPEKHTDLAMPSAPALKSGPKAIRVAVLEPAVDPSTDPRVKAAMGQAITAEVRKLERVTAIAADEIQQMMSFQRNRQLMGCSEDTSCMAELVDALAADDLVSIRVTAIGQSVTFAVQRLDARRSKVSQSFTRQLPRGSGEELLALVGPAVQALFPERGLLPGKTRGVDKDVARKLNPPPLPRWVFFATAGTGAAVGAGGAVFGLMASQSHGRYQALVDSSATTVVQAEELDQLKRDTQQNSLFANALFIGAGAVALGAAFEAVFTDWNDDRAALAVVPAPGGAGLAVRFTFP